MRYFFDVIDQDGVTEDTYGIVCRDLDHARCQAGKVLAEIAAAELHRSDEFELSMRVRDDAQTEVYQVRLSVKGQLPSEAVPPPFVGLL